MKLLLLLLSVLVLGALAEKARFDFYKVHRLIPHNEPQLKALRDLMQNNSFDFWKEPSAVGRVVDVMVPPHMEPSFTDFLEKTGIQSNVHIENVQTLIDEEEAVLETRTRAMDWSNYHKLEEFHTWMDDLAKQYSEVKVIIAGKTYEKRDIKGLEITFGKNFPTVFLEAGIHAREWISAAATSWMVNEMLATPKTSIWKQYNYVYIPFYNPDGYAFSWDSNRMWRKTRTPYKSGSKTCYGADPNRNWDFHWGLIGTSNDPCSEIYRGPKPFSEVETKTLSEYLTANAKSKKMDIYLAFHSYGQFILYPWAHTDKPAPLAKLWQKVGDAAAKDLHAVNNVTFEVGNGCALLYASCGESSEWFYGNYNSTLTYLYELRDKGSYGFILPPKYILPSAKEIYPAVERMLTEYSKLPPKY